MMILTRKEGTQFIGYGSVKHCPHCGKSTYSHIIRWYKTNPRPYGVPMPNDTLTVQWWLQCGATGCGALLATFSGPQLLLKRRREKSRIDHEKVSKLLLEGLLPTKGYIDGLTKHKQTKFLRNLKRCGFMDVWHLLHLASK